jgi:non-reducing end alpha-L-arabinofuranosidase
MAKKLDSLFGNLVSLVVLLSALNMGCAAAVPGAAVAAVAVANPQPCDLLASATPCVAAISTTRALYAAYTGPLYQVTRQSDNTHSDIGLLPDGYANAAAQDSFCANTTCTITKIYDQSSNHNDLTPAPPGGAAKGPGPGGYDLPAVANALPAMVGGHKVYGIAIAAGMGYRNDAPTGTAVHGEPEGVYMVTSALDLNDKCCFDFGNAETNNLDNDKGHMDAINVMCYGSPCSLGAGLDMENGIYGNLAVPSGTAFVTDMGASDGQHTYAIYQGNAQSGGLTTTGITPLPKGYQPMQQEGAIILGIGGDNSNWATGYFFEGVMTKGMPTQGALETVQSNIVKAGYAGTLQP